MIPPLTLYAAGLLSQLFIVSGTTIGHEQTHELGNGWQYSELISVSGAWYIISLPLTKHRLDEVDDIRVCIRPAARNKCPRCWAYTREEDQKVCGRCEGVISK
jgi:isoleucyl-tRNA synthetase